MTDHDRTTDKHRITLLQAFVYVILIGILWIFDPTFYASAVGMFLFIGGSIIVLAAVVQEFTPDD